MRLTLAVGKADGKSLSLRLALADIGGGIPNPAAVAAHVGGKLHIRNDWKLVSQILPSISGKTYRSGWRKP